MTCLGDSGHRQHTPCWHGLLFPLELERWHRLCLDPLPHQTPGRLADEHLAGPGRLFESGGHIHGIAHRMFGCAAHEHLAGVHPDTKSQSTPQRWDSAGLSAARSRCMSKAARTALRASSSRSGDAEEGDDSIADELLNRPTVALEGGSHHREIALQQRP